MVRRARINGLAAASVIAVIVGACGPSTSPSGSPSAGGSTGETPSGGPAADSSLVVALGTQAFEGLDPHVQASPPTNAIVKLIYDGLVTADPENAFHPQLATNWENPDPLTWIFDLQSGVTFQDGTPFDADAVVANFERFLDPANELSRSFDFAAVDAVTAVDDMTVQFALKQPFPTILNYLAYPDGSIISPAAIEEFGADLATHPVGTGPYKLQELVAGQSITLERFDDYWGGTPGLESIEFVPVSADATRLSMLESGQADIIANVPVTSIDQLSSSESLAVIEAPSNRVIQIQMNTSKTPFGDVRVRQALNYAVDKQAIVDSVLQGLGTVATSYLAPVTPGFHDTAGYEYDPDRAKQLLADADFPDGFSTTMWVPTGRYFQGEQTAQAVQGYLGAIGVDVELVPMEFGAFIEAITQPQETNESEMFLLGWEAYPDPSWITANVFGTEATPPGSWNTMFFSDPDVDALIADLQASSDGDERQTLYGQIQEQVVEDAPWIFLHSAKSVWGARADISGIEVLPDDTLVLHDATVGS